MAEECFSEVRLNAATEKMMENFNENYKAVTFDEMTFEDGPSDIHPIDTNLTSHITKNISLKGGGIMSAAMDTVTEAELALALAKMGGMGILHRNISPENQAAMIKWVRTRIYHGGRIENPKTFNQNIKFSVMQKIIEEKGYTFTGFPIVDDEGKLVGLISRDEMDFAEDRNPYLFELMKKFGDIIVAKDDPNDEMMTSEKARETMRSEHVKKLPVIDPDGHLIGLYVWNDLREDERKKEMFSLDSDGHFLVGAAIGVAEEEMHRVKLLIENGCRVLVIDTSHGASKPARDQIGRIREVYGHRADIIVGNVASHSSATYLLEGKYLPDAIKCGISVGSICTTREVTGHGVPQMTAIYRVYCAVATYCLLDIKRPWIPIIADGGIRNSGDILKCYAMGASGVMLGSIFGGTKESPGTQVHKGGKTYKKIRGMGCKSAMEERQGSRKRYGFKENDDDEEGLTKVQKTKVVPEGIEGLVQVQGSVESVMTKLCGGIRGGLAHSGSKSIREFQKTAVLWSQSSVGALEGKPHDIFDIHE